MSEKKSMITHFKERFGVDNNLSIEPDFPGALNIELNNTCNQQCIFCEYHSPRSPYAKELKSCVMDKEFVCEILSQAWELGIGKKELGLYSAGEVFLYKDFAEIVRYAKSLGFPYIFVTTNGVLATPKKLIEVINSGLDSIRFSVNAATRETYRSMHGRDDFDRVIDNIRCMREYLDKNNIQMNTSVSYVVTKENIEEISKAKELLKNLVDEILFIPVIGLSKWDKELSERLSLDEYEEKDRVENYNLSCPIPFNTMYITSAGKVKLCCNTYKTDIETYDLTNDLNLEAAWKSRVYQKYRKAFIEKNIKGTVCENCRQVKQGVSRVMMDV